LSPASLKISLAHFSSTVAEEKTNGVTHEWRYFKQRIEISTGGRFSYIRIKVMSPRRQDGVFDHGRKRYLPADLRLHKDLHPHMIGGLASGA